MKCLSLIIFLSLVSGCGPASERTLAEATAEQSVQAREDTSTGSFRMRNGEIREEMIQMIEAAGIEFWIGEEGEINYNLADGEAIDRIGNEVISEYITRN